MSGMTKTLDKLIKKIKSLPVDEQETVGRAILDNLNRINKETDENANKIIGWV